MCECLLVYTGSVRLYLVFIFVYIYCFFFFQAEDGIRDVERSRGLGDVYKRQADYWGILPWKLGFFCHYVL